MSAIMELLAQNLGLIGLILISPTLYRLAYGLTLWLAVKMGKNQKDIVIKHFHNGQLISETTIKVNPNEPLFIKKHNQGTQDEL